MLDLLDCISDPDAHPKKGNKNPKMRIHKLENLKKAFDFMRDQVRGFFFGAAICSFHVLFICHMGQGIKLVNVGAEDVISGSEKIILALLWSLINHYSVGTIEMDGLAGKEGLLLWCQRQAKGHDNVTINNFSKSWANGLAFCAILHRFGPEHIPYDELSAADPQKNLELAFKVGLAFVFHHCFHFDILNC